MITKDDNLFHVFAASVARGVLSERYLLAGHTFETSLPTGETTRVLSVACNVFPGKQLVASDALAAHYNMVAQSGNYASFQKDAACVIDAEGIAVDVRIKQVCEHPVVYRAIFSRVDSVKTYTELQGEVGDLKDRVRDLTSRLDQLSVVK